MSKSKTVDEAREAAEAASCNGLCGVTPSALARTVHQEQCPVTMTLDELIRAVRASMPCYCYEGLECEPPYDVVRACPSCQAREG